MARHGAPAGAPAPTLPSWAKEGDHSRTFLTPDGRDAKTLAPEELKALAVELGIKVAPDAGHKAVMDAFEDAQREVYRKAGECAVVAWLESKRAVG